MSWRAESNQNGNVAQFTNSDTGEVITWSQYDKCMQIYKSMQQQGWQSRASADALYVAITFPTVVLHFLSLFVKKEYLYVAITFPTVVLLCLLIAAAHKMKLFPWQQYRVSTAVPSPGSCELTAAWSSPEQDPVWTEIDELIAKQKSLNAE
jgi:hypothetical protein